jgi:hypothetical protein
MSTPTAECETGKKSQKCSHSYFFASSLSFFLPTLVYLPSFTTMTAMKSRLENFSSTMEDIIDKVGQPLKPFIPVLARFLIVATFLEDSLRISMQWGEQRSFMEQRRGFPPGLSHAFLSLNVIVSPFCFLYLAPGADLSS